MMRWRSGLISLLWLMVVGQAFAAGLGEINVQSWLGERLQARVPLLGMSDNDTDRVRVQLASVRHYHEAGLNFPAVLHGVEFSLEQGAVLISTAQRVNEPILELLLLVNTPEGEVRRQFTLLLDLPPLQDSKAIVFSRPATTSVMVDNIASATPAPATTVVPPAASLAVVAPSNVTPEPSVATTPARSGDQYGPVRRHESLWSIAQQLQPQLQLPLATIVAGLYNANVSAFVSRNPHQLMEGSRLIVPSHWPDTPITAMIAASKANTAVLADVSAATTIVATTEGPTTNEKKPKETALPVTVLTEQNQQLRGEIAQLTLRLAELETRLREQQKRATINAFTNNSARTESASAPVTTQNDTIQTGVLKPLLAVNDVSLPSVVAAAPKTKPIPTPEIVTASNQNNWQSWASFGVALITLIWVAAWWWQRRQAVHKPSVNDFEWQERKRAARAAYQSDHSIPTMGDWRHQDATPEPPNAAESMEIKLQYVRSAVDTFLLFQRYSEALAFIRREIFEAGHESPLGHRLDALFRETKAHLQSLGIEAPVPTGEPKFEVASQRVVSNDQHVVTPLRKARPPARRDVL